MNREWREQVEGIRQRGPIERTLLDEYFDIRYDRREFIRRATVFGLSLSSIPMVLESCGTTKPTPKVGGRLKVGIIPPPRHTIEPHTFADQGRPETGSIAGGHLMRPAARLPPGPERATTWTPHT